MNNSFSRPSLGINQTALFNASNEMAQNASLRQKCINQPQRFLGKYGVTISDKTIEVPQKTSEVCTFPLVFCVAAFLVALGAAVVTVAAAAGAVLAAGSCWTEFGGCTSIENPMLTEKYNGIC
jgi:hypothetical protein